MITIAPLWGITLLIAIFIYSVLHFFLSPSRNTHIEPRPLPYAEKPPHGVSLKRLCDILNISLVTCSLTTSDGYTVTLHRLNWPLSKSSLSSSYHPNDKIPVLCIPGLLQSPMAFLSAGYDSLAYLLLKNGHTVYLGNNRGGSVDDHLRENSLSSFNWNFTVTDMALDIVAMAQYIDSPLALMGHSQGTAQILHLLHNNWLDKDTFKRLILLAPALYGGEILEKSIFFKLLHTLNCNGKIFTFFFGRSAFMPILMVLHRWTKSLPGYTTASYMVFHALFHWNDRLWNASCKRVHFQASPVYTSVRCIKWWLDEFKCNCSFIDERVPFPAEMPPIFAVTGGKDTIVNNRLFMNRMQREGVLLENIHRDEYSHLDVLWSRDLLDVVGTRLLVFLEE